MPETIAEEQQSETLTEGSKAEAVKTKTGYAVGYGLTKDDVPAEITPEARAPQCPAHPDGAWTSGAGYAGGGFGPYRLCSECGSVFAKVQWGNDSSNAR